MTRILRSTKVLIGMFMMAARFKRRSKLQHDVAQDSSEAQERAADDFTHRAPGVGVAGGAGGFGSTAGTRGGSGAGGTGSGKGGRNDRGSGRDGSGGGALFDLVIYPSNKWSQVGVLHVVGEDELDNSRGGTGEVLWRGEVRALLIDHNSVPASASEGGARKTDYAVH